MTRRRLLQGAGMALAAGAFPGRGAGQTLADLPVSDAMTRLSTYMSQAREHELPAEVIEKAMLHVLDTIAAMVSGAELPPGIAARKFAREYGGKQVATVVADTVVCGPMEAAMVNGEMAHADKTDDTFTGPWHPGCAVLPAALALGEQFGNSGAQLLRAVVLGYDIGNRVLLTLQPGLAESHKLTFGIGGTFGAAAAAGCATGLTAQQMRWLISYAAQMSSGFNSFPRDIEHFEKGFTFAGKPARDGVMGALLVKGGWNGVNDVLSGPNNFLQANAPTASAEVFVEKLGERYDIMRAGIKRWSTGGPNQAPLDALQALLKKQTVDVNQIQEIMVTSGGSFEDNDNSGPSYINIQHAVAMMLNDKKLTFKSIHDRSRMTDPAIVKLREKVKLNPGAKAPRPPIIQITMADGTKISQDNSGAGGGGNNPFSREQLIAKCNDLMTPVLGAKTKPLIDRVLALETVKNIRELRPLLQAAPYTGAPRLSEYPNARP
jgi:2-methylcitrate dehydratase PrpD